LLVVEEGYDVLVQIDELVDPKLELFLGDVLLVFGFEISFQIFELLAAALAGYQGSWTRD